ncbi:MAG TPA: hypothetical protein VJ812_02195 [Gemmatimonadaceae bacterium]|nr:hypothetical protein [Gemmatimonadaceae bacterium]
MAVTMRVSRGLPFLLSAWLLPGIEARAQDVGPYLPISGFNQGDFRFGTSARTSLRTLWQVSAGARQERVACIGGYRFEGVTFITRVEPVIASSADSMSVAATASLLQCRPPDWLGTIHTHVATKDGQPYVTFSGADRGVMMRWESIWQSVGVFCVLFDDRRAHCEAGHESSGDAFYAYSRGNNLGL